MPGFVQIPQPRRNHWEIEAGEVSESLTDLVSTTHRRYADFIHQGDYSGSESKILKLASESPGLFWIMYFTTELHLSGLLVSSVSLLRAEERAERTEDGFSGRTLASAEHRQDGQDRMVRRWDSPELVKAIVEAMNPADMPRRYDPNMLGQVVDTDALNLQLADSDETTGLGEFVAAHEWRPISFPVYSGASS